MKKEDMFDLIGEVDERKVADALNAVPHKRKTTWVKWSAIAASLCVMISGIWAARQSDERETPSQAMSQTDIFFGGATQETMQKGNNMFTDKFFSDIVEISDSRCGQVSGAQMEPVILFLKNLSLTETDEALSSKNESGEQLYGLDLITFQKSNGTSITFLRNHEKMSSADAGSYEIEGVNLNEGLTEAFNQAFNH